MPPVPLYEWTSCPFWVLQIWTHLSKLPLAKNFPSGENATLYTGSLCLVRVCTQAPLSHIPTSFLLPLLYFACTDS